MNKNELSAGTAADKRNTADDSTSASLVQNGLLSAAIVNHNELMLMINFKALAEEHGVRKGTIYYSDTFKSWVIQGHPEIDLICIDAPFVKGQTVEGLSGKASRFNGKEIKNVVIRSNMWCAVF